MIKAVKVLNTISILLFSGVLLLVYAYLPIMVDVNLEGVKDIHKQTLFYYLFGAFVVVNFILRIGINYGTRGISNQLGGWIRSILFIVNFYFATIIGFIGVVNNTGHINPESYAYLNFLGPIFLVIWIIGLIFFILKK